MERIIIFLAVCIIGMPPLQAQVTISSQIAISAGDVEEMGSNGTTPGTIDFSSSDLELVADGADGNQFVGIRFPGLNIPQGATITNAYIQFTVDETDTQAGDKFIWTEAADSSDSFTLLPFNVSTRPKSVDSITWTNIPVWNTVGQAGISQQTPDLSVIVQEIISRPGWAPGNAMTFVITGTGERVAESFDGDPTGAPELFVTFTSSTYLPGTFPLTHGSVWKYEDSGTDLGTAWRMPNYADASWAFGSAILGYGNGNEATTLDFGSSASAKHPTYYLRNSFIALDLTNFDSLEFSVLRDDGVIVYINGTEAFRMNMPTGPIAYDTLASTAVQGADETTYFTQRVANTLLSNDTNVIAVELHQSDVGSSDLSFDLGIIGLLGPFPIDTFPLAAASNWMLLDTGANLDAVLWTDTTFNSTDWQWGPAPLGYGDPIINTNVGFGNDANNKYITTYFRKEFHVPNAGTLTDSLVLKLMRDDGAIVYLNGVEVIRDNMPVAPTTYLTFSSTTVNGADETNFFNFLIPSNLLHSGRNVVTAEIHQRDGTSSDLTFDLGLEEFTLPPPGTCPNGIQNHIGCFTSLEANGQSPNLELPSTHTFQMLIQQGDPYSSSPGILPGNNDFTGYVPINGSSREGYLSINHENTPGGVSMLTMHFDSTTNLWAVDSSHAVDFSGVVTTARNCSGGITPWGTVVTCEETFNSGDLNNDGYQDVGWAVEIDPVTKAVVDYGNGPAKLWALGRMSHENLVIADDSVTAFFGEDGGTSCVYKFVADSPANLSSGDLYVLAVDNGLDVNGDPIGSMAHWIPVPNATQNDRNNINSLATAVGGTSFFGVEDVEIDPLSDDVVFTSKNNGRTYRFGNIGTTGITNFRTFVGGQTYSMYTPSGLQFEPWGNGNDNLAFDDLGNLWVMQDGDNNYVWVVRPDHTPQNPHVELFARSSLGSEPTGISFSPDYKFLFISMQHPSASLNTSQVDAAMDTVIINRSSTMVISRKEFLGVGNQLPIANFVADTTLISEGDSVVFTNLSTLNSDSLQWAFPGGTPTASSDSTPVITYNTAGTYDASLIASNANGSDTLARPGYIVVSPSTAIASPDESSHQVHVFPNPVNGGKINIEVKLPPSARGLQIALYDLEGRLLTTLLDQNDSNPSTRYQFDLSDLELPAQQLLLRIQSGDWVTTKSLQIIR